MSMQISLMEDQVQALKARDIKACFLGSAQCSSQVEDVVSGSSSTSQTCIEY